MATRRSDQLRIAAAAFLESHAAWQEDVNRANPDASYWDAAETLLATFASGDIPRDCRGLNQRVEEFDEQCAAFDEQQEQGDTVLMPSRKFFGAVELLAKELRAAEPRELPPLETIAENAGRDGAVVARKVADGKGAHGWDAEEDRFGDMFKFGVIDICISSQMKKNIKILIF